MVVLLLCGNVHSIWKLWLLRIILFQYWLTMILIPTPKCWIVFMDPLTRSWKENFGTTCKIWDMPMIVHGVWLATSMQSLTIKINLSANHLHPGATAGFTNLLMMQACWILDSLGILSRGPIARQEEQTFKNVWTGDSTTQIGESYSPKPQFTIYLLSDLTTSLFSYILIHFNLAGRNLFVLWKCGHVIPPLEQLFLKHGKKADALPPLHNSWPKSNTPRLLWKTGTDSISVMSKPDFENSKNILHPSNILPKPTSFWRKKR